MAIFKQMKQHQSKTIQLDSFELAAGEATGDIAVECCLWGSLDKPLIVVMGGISASRWAIDCPSGKQAGWWNQVVNDESTLNTTDFQFLTFEYFTYPDRVTNPPVISTLDQANLLHQIQTKLNLPQFHAVIGSSYGGMVSLAFAAKYPKSLNHLVCIAAADKNSVKSQALRQIQRKIIGLGEQFADDSAGQKQFISLARSLAMIGYRGEPEWEQRFQLEQPGKGLEAITSYLEYHGDRFADQFSAARYYQLSRSIDFHQIDVSAIEAEALLIGINTDQMVPVNFIKNMSEKFNHPCQTHLINSKYGHDGFLLEAEQIDAIFHTYFSEYIHDYIEPNSRCTCGY